MLKLSILDVGFKQYRVLELAIPMVKIAIHSIGSSRYYMVKLAILGVGYSRYYIVKLNTLGVGRRRYYMLKLASLGVGFSSAECWSWST